MGRGARALAAVAGRTVHGKEGVDGSSPSPSVSPPSEDGREGREDAESRTDVRRSSRGSGCVQRRACRRRPGSRPGVARRVRRGDRSARGVRSRCAERLRCPSSAYRRLNCVLKLMTKELRARRASPHGRVLREEPPRPRGQAAAASPARRRGAHPVSGAADGRGALRAERYVARAVSQPRFAQTSSVAAALFMV